MNGDFAAKYIWTCAFLVVCSLAGKLFLFFNWFATKRVATIVRPIKTQTFQSLLYQQVHFDQIKSKVAANNTSNVHISPDVLWTMLLLQQGDLYKSQQQVVHSISRSSHPEVFCKKLLLKLAQNSQESTCFVASF